MKIFNEQELNYVKKHFGDIIDSDIDSAPTTDGWQDYLRDTKRDEGENIEDLFLYWDDINTDEDINKLFCECVYNCLGLWTWDADYTKAELMDFLKDKIYVDLFSKICEID